jgi:two-component system nitrogen regulation sensor histidine kinase GlnL
MSVVTPSFAPVNASLPQVPPPPVGWSAAYDALASGLVLLDAQSCILAMNSAAQDLWSVSQKTVLGQPITELFESDRALQRALQGARGHDFTALRFEAVARQAGALVPVHVVVSEARPDATVLVEVLTLAQQSRQERDAHWQQQAQANKELIRNLAHEIKNPLGGIRGAAQLLQMELVARELVDYTNVIIHEADRLQSLVDKLLAPHRHAHARAAVNIHEVCERVRSLVLAEFSGGLRVQRDYDTSLPELHADKQQLIQAVLNVAQNAAQALVAERAKGTACIVLRTRVARQLTFAGKRHKLALELHIEDNGPGIAPHIRGREFAPLVSGREGGTGLGLTLAQTFVQQHQGVMTCESVPGRTVFKLVLPLLAAENN